MMYKSKKSAVRQRSRSSSNFIFLRAKAKCVSSDYIEKKNPRLTCLLSFAAWRNGGTQTCCYGIYYYLVNVLECACLFKNKKKFFLSLPLSRSHPRQVNSDVFNPLSVNKQATTSCTVNNHS
jgi:hypothetical protein